MSVTVLTHGRSQLALHTVRAGGRGHPLLLLHGLGESTPAEVPVHLAPWPGPVLGLDFTGHGGSTVPKGGGYTAEVLMADADTVLRNVGPVTVHGRGLGAYVGLLIAGARADLVRGAILVDGPGLVGGGIRPGSSYVIHVDDDITGSPDPYALAELSRDVRPPDYAMTYVRHAVEYGELETPIAVCTVVRPEWIGAIVGAPGVVDCTVDEAVALYAPLDPEGP